MGGSHDAALFSRSLKNISDYLQLKFSNDVSKAVRAMKGLTINIPPPRPRQLIPPEFLFQSPKWISTSGNGSTQRPRTVKMSTKNT